MQMDMTPIDFANTSGWEVFHDEKDQLFKLRSRSGAIKAGMYTSRMFAERALVAYLETLSIMGKAAVDKKLKAKVGRPKKVA